MTHLEKLIELRAKALAEITDAKAAREAVVAAAEAEERNATDEELAECRTFTGTVKSAQARVDDLSEQIADLEAEEARAGKNDELTKHVARAKIEVKEGRTYEKGNGKSYIQDLLARSFGVDEESGSIERLNAHAREVRALDRTDGNGGYLVPPKWMMDRFIELARPGRAYANLVPTEPLPGGTDSFNLPKISTGTSTAVQTADNETVEEVDLNDDTVRFDVKTIAGAQALSIQALEQSPLSFDEIIFRDLAGDYATKLDLQVIAGSNSSGQVKGVRNAAGILTVTATDATTQLAKIKTVYAKIADAIQQVHTSRFAAPEVIVMHPRRWAAFQAVFTSNDVPFVAGSGSGSLPQLGAFGGVIPAGYVGQLHGLPVVTDPNLPTNLGAGTNEDVIHVLKVSDLLLFESGIRTRTLEQTRADRLTILLQVSGFLAFSAERQPKGVCEIGGTALTAPTFV